MKLLKCHIENFGQLSNFDYEFQEGLNTIQQENGFGKTTFANFIKAMFYGLEAKRNTKQLIDRKKYFPWQGGAFGGSIDFEVKGKPYKIERFFGKKEADDVFKLYDLNTNLESNDFSANLGEEIFKLNKEAYERSTYISGQNIETSMNDSINAKLGNILENENDINTSEQAIKALDEAIKIYKKTGSRGELNEKLLEKTNLEKKLEQSKIDEKTLNERKVQNDKLKNIINDKIKQQKQYQKTISTQIQEEARKAKLEQYKILTNQLKEVKSNLEQYKQKINSDSEIKEKMESNQLKINNLSAKITVLEKNIAKNKKINILFFLLFLILLAIGGIVTFTGNKIGIVSLSISVIFLVIDCIKMYKLHKTKNNYINKIQEKANLDHLNETLKSLHEKQRKEQEIELEKLNKEYESKLKYVNDYEKQNDIKKIEALVNFNTTNMNKEELESKLYALNEEINKLNDEKNYNQNQIEILESTLETAFDIENEIEELEQKIVEMKDNCDILEKTKYYLETAKEKFSSHYLNTMKESFLKNINLINGKNMDINLDINLNVQVNEKGSNREIRYFSTGYKDLIYICMRLSLIEALFEEDKPFIILDDPFVNLDNLKIKNAIDLLNNLAKDYQVIYFICHESRKINMI